VLSWISQLSEWVDVLQQIRQRVASEIPVDDADTFAQSLRTQWQQAIADVATTDAQQFGFDASAQLLRLWQRYSQGLPLASRELVEMVLLGKEEADPGSEARRRIDAYLEAIKEHQLLFLDIAAYSLSATQDAFEAAVNQRSLRPWLNAWITQFDQYFAQFALGPTYSVQFAKLVECGIAVHEMLDLTPASRRPDGAE
jgi:hypothetical protein